MDGFLRPLCCGVEHVFNEDAVAGSWVVDENVCDCTNQLAILDDGTAGHFCGK